jgi:uncharacterized protein (TIGR04255 family)
MAAAAVPISPYDDEFLEEYPLGRAPLVRVLAQVRHPSLLALTGDSSNSVALRIASSLADQFPIFEATRERAIAVTPEGVRETEEGGTLLWRLRNADETWQVSFSNQFLAFETSNYGGRSDFCKRLESVLSTYKKEVNPPFIIRTGIRYTNRISGEAEIKRIEELFRPELLGPTAAKLPPDVQLGHSISGAQFATAAGGSLLNWGLLSANGIFDPMIPPLEKPSWLLDIDVFNTEKKPFDVAGLTGLAQSLASRAYTHFRWAITEEFLNTFGGH